MFSRLRLTFIVARRFLLSKASDGFVSFIAWVSILGVALGVLALVVVTSVINGFENELQKIIAGMNGDVIVYSQGEPIREPEKFLEKLKALTTEIQKATPSFILELMVSSPKGLASGAILEGVDLETVDGVTLLSKRIVEGRMPKSEGEIALGVFLAQKIGAKIDDEIRLTLPDPDGQNSKLILGKVVGISKMGMYEYDSKYLFTALDFLQKSLDMPGKVTALRLKLTQSDRAESVIQKLGPEVVRPMRIKSWAQLNRNLFYAIRLEKVVIGIILTIIIVVAAFNVISTLMMMIHDKTREIAILKVMGFKKGQAFGMFVLLGLGMSALGTGAGLGLGLLINKVLAETQIIKLPPDVYYIGFLPVIVQWNELFLIVGVSLIIGLLATFWPAATVSQRSPLDGIRYE